jgi:hypothetical protein
VDRELGGVGPRDEVDRTDEVEKLLSREPLPAANDLVFHHRDVNRRSAERGCAEAQEEPGQGGKCGWSR